VFGDQNLVTTGTSMFETIELLNVVELKVTNVVVFINRKQKRPKLYRRLDYNFVPLSNLHLMKDGKVVEEVIIFIK
jgi:orotate phosphoribosyltransferase